MQVTIPTYVLVADKGLLRQRPSMTLNWIIYPYRLFLGESTKMKLFSYTYIVFIYLYIYIYIYITGLFKVLISH